ncbi:MAG: hypothetical protein BA874_03390 [Desulfuromonadales bacterium C00003068]|nr:MAG: hypothetical protein BA874_03390 [Desulfuromonadales bacterium C00003068]
MTKAIIGLVMGAIMLFAIAMIGINVMQTQIDANTVNPGDELASTQNAIVDTTVITFDVIGYLPYALMILALFIGLMMFAGR